VKRVFLYYFILLTTFSTYSYQWPSSKDFLSKLFGANENLRIVDGIKFSSDNQSIYPLTDGEVIFYQDSFEFGDLDYKGEEGNLLVLKHIGEFNSIYRNFILSDNLNTQININKTDIIGISGNSWDEFIFSVYDNKNDSYINPQQILPFLEDGTTPVINNVYIMNNDVLEPLYMNKRVLGGESILYIDSWDVIYIKGKYSRFVPFSVNVFVDGFERYNISFSSLKEIEDDIYLSGFSDVPLKNFLSIPSYLFGGKVFLTNGRSLIEVVVKDINGNETSKSFSLLVE